MGNQQIGSFTTISKLGKGIYGKTRLSQTTDKFLYTIKIYEVLPNFTKDKVMKELQHHYNQIASTGINKYRDFISIDDHRFGVMCDYCKEGNLTRHINEPIDIGALLLEMKKIAINLANMHRNKVCHGDLKPNNIFIKQGNLILGDFTIPSFTNTLRLREILGTYDYFPPQHYQGGVTMSGDVWSLGLIFLEMVLRKSIRELLILSNIQKPSINVTQYPPNQLISQVQPQNLRALIFQMLSPDHLKRPAIQQVITRLEQNSSKAIKTLRLNALNQQDKDKLIQGKQEYLNIQILSFNADYSNPYSQHFQVVDNVIKRLDDQLVRYQVVAREKIPLGVWVISASIPDYGWQNEEVSFGFTTEERKKQKSSGDIDMCNSLAYWSNRKSKTGNLCINGQWFDEPLPYVEQGVGLFQAVVNTFDRNIQWHINGKEVKVSRMPIGYWDQSIYFFSGLMGKNCTIMIQKVPVNK